MRARGRRAASPRASVSIAAPHAGDAARTASRSAHALLITGRPGVGKTTIARAVAERLPAGRVRGFHTEELRVEGGREGFRLVAFGGRAGVLARAGAGGPHRVGRYGVDVSVMDEIAVPALTPDPGGRCIFVVDEIGKMECLSPGFVGAMRRLLDSDALIVATIAQQGGGFIDEVKRRPDVVVWEVTHDSRDELPDRVLGWLDRSVE